MERIVDHKKKGISSQVVLSVYMTGDWSKEKKEVEDQALLDEIHQIANEYAGEGNEVMDAQLKKWKYAEAEEVVWSPYLKMGKEGRILVCGDAFLREKDEAGRTRFESAFLSGISAGESIDSLRG